MAGTNSARITMSARQWTVVLLLVLSVLINYIDRSNLSLAVPAIQHQFSLSPIRVGLLLSAFFWTYALAQLCGFSGYLSDRFPVGWVLATGYIVWSGATILTGVVTGFAALYIARLLLGLGESVAYPCYSRVFARLPQEQRGRANAFIDAGTKLGPSIGAFVGGILLVHFGWRVLFVVLGAGGLVWLLPWFSVMPRTSHRALTEEVRGPWVRRLLSMPCAWGCFFGHFAGNYFYYFLLTWMPAYLAGEKKLSISHMSQLTSALFLLIALSTITAGYVTDALISRGLSPTRVRRSSVVIGLGSASILLALVFVPNSLAFWIAIMCTACLGFGAYTSNHWAIAQTLAGTSMAGRWSSVQNGIANLSGVVAPWATGLIVQWTGSARMSFVLTGAVALAGAFSWALLIRRVEPVDWGTSARILPVEV
ncbi:MAG TPA: MFS transporter [Acidobacteriaceae bacterium]|jgi:MFS family permease|nr:MFS transporter [Acidobacteriaceae bacterium]